jgi:hypothetical protein
MPGVERRSCDRLASMARTQRSAIWRVFGRSIAYIFHLDRQMLFGQILHFQGSYDACLSSFAKFLE